jgi:hypothetical protein
MTGKEPMGAHPPTRHCMCKDCAPSFDTSLPEEVEPVAFMYEHDGCIHNRDNPPILTYTRWNSVKEPYTETPLFTTPPSAHAAALWMQRKAVEAIENADTNDFGYIIDSAGLIDDFYAILPPNDLVVMTLEAYASKLSEIADETFKRLGYPDEGELIKVIVSQHMKELK